MKKDLQKALDDVETTYGELIEIANEMTRAHFASIDDTIQKIDIQQQYALSLDKLRELLLDLSIKSYTLSEIKDRSLLKQECAETIRKHKYATNFNLTDGTVAFKENSALINSSEEILVELVYDLVASMFKTKVDEVHRFIDTVKTILMTRMQEAKFMNIGIDNTIPATTNGKINL